MDRNLQYMICLRCSFEMRLLFYDNLARMEVDGCQEANFAQERRNEVHMPELWPARV